MGSADTLDHAGFIVSKSAVDAHELWRIVLPIEDPTVFNSALEISGFNQYVDTRARFSPDGLTAYLATATATATTTRVSRLSIRSTRPANSAADIDETAQRRH